MKDKKLLRGYVFIILSAIIFGLMPLMAKFIYEEGVNPPSLVLLRNILSVPFLWILAFAGKNRLKLKAVLLPKISFIALMGCCVTPLLLFSSYKHIPSGTATVFHFIYPAVTVIGEFLFLKNELSRGHVLSVIICILGIALFYNPDTRINLTGSFHALLSGITYAIYVVCLSGFKHKEISGFTFSLYVASVSSAIMLLVCIFTKQLSLPVTLVGWLLTLLFAISLNVGAVVLFQKGTFLIGGGRASVLSTLEPVTSILAGVIILSEKASAFTIIGTILVITASILIAVYDIKSQQSNT